MKVLSFLWFSRLIFEIVIFTLIIFEKLLVFYLDFVFVVNLLIHKIYIFSFQGTYPFGLVENKGFEPLTPCVQGRCSPS